MAYIPYIKLQFKKDNIVNYILLKYNHLTKNLLKSLKKIVYKETNN